MKTGRTARGADTARAFAALAIALMRGASAAEDNTMEPNAPVDARKKQTRTTSAR